ncbi:MAG: hypothetical protein ACD_83C00079G0001 [uncultured bacterium]|nr:MAG: hypothetical protein ACD_83C00079G0001 [uncultured bacterium]
MFVKGSAQNPTPIPATIIITTAIKIILATNRLILLSRFLEDLPPGLNSSTSLINTV